MKKRSPMNWLFGEQARRLGIFLAVTALTAVATVTGLSIGGHAGFDIEASTSGNYLAGRFANQQRDNTKAADFLARALRDDPDNLYILRRAFVQEVAAGRMVRARRLARRLVKIDQSNALAHMVVGLSDFRTGKYESARRHFAISAPHPVGKLMANLLIAWSQAAGGDPRKALETLNSKKTADTFGVFRAFQSALIADLAGLEDEALKYYRSAYDDAGSSLRVIQSYGSFLERTGREDDARALYLKYQKAMPTHPIVRRIVERNSSGKTPRRLVRTPDMGVAEALFGIASATADDTGLNFALRITQLALFMYPDFQVARMLLGGIYEDGKNYEMAVSAYSSLSPDSPLKLNAELQVAENLDRLKRTDEATAFLKKVIARHPRNPQIRMVLGNILRGRSKFAEAAKAYSEAVKLVGKPTKRDWTLFYFRGISYERTKRWDLAEADFKLSLKLNPDQPSVMNYLGYSWVEQGRNLAAAFQILKKAVELRPNDGYIVDSLGWAYYHTGRYDKAVEQLERAVQLRPEDPVINDHLGDAYWRVDRRREAKFQWVHARDLKPEPELLKKIEAKIVGGLDAARPVKLVSAGETKTTGAGAQEAAGPGTSNNGAEKRKVAQAPAAKPAKPRKVHVVGPGESLWSIAEDYLGAGLSYNRILDANRELIKNQNQIFPGQKLIIPDAN